MRQQKWVSTGIYQPVHQRRPYGRRIGSAPLLEELREDLHAYSAREVPPWIARTVAVPMPRGGGVRWLAVCPRCARRVAHLYHLPFVWQEWDYLCRVCWGLRYTSQYHGRRPEASTARLDALRASAQRAHQPATRAWRRARYRVARDRWRMHQDRHRSRRTLAFTLTLTILLRREVAREDRAWERILRAAWRETAADRAALIPYAPAWAAAALAASLPTDWPVPEVPVAAYASLVSEETLAELRVAYAALGPRAQRRAA